MAAASTPIIGFIKFQNAIGLYQADYESWILDLNNYCAATGKDISQYVKRKDKRFAKKLACPVRKDDVAELVAWFDAHAAINPDSLRGKLAKLDFLALDQQFEEHLPVIFYDFDERTSFENPDLNPFTPFDDYLPEGWKSIVVEGFDALVPDAYIYWSEFDAILHARNEQV